VDSTFTALRSERQGAGVEPGARSPRRLALRPLAPALLFGALAAVTIAGLPYYLSSVPERVRSPLHHVFRPTGLVGQSAGIVAFGFFLFLWLYPLRKKFRWLAFTGAVGTWLDVHIVAGLAVPWLGALHAGFRFDGLIGLGYGAMFLVALSGIVGKFLYAHIPRSKSGLELSRDEVESQRVALVGRIAAATGIVPKQVERTLASVTRVRTGLGPLAIIFGLVTNDIAAFRAAASLRRTWEAHGKTGSVDRRALREAVRLARREIALAQRVRMLEATHRVFRYWHIAHRPFAVTALVAVATHVVVAIALGVTWFG